MSEPVNNALANIYDAEDAKPSGAPAAPPEPRPVVDQQAAQFQTLFASELTREANAAAAAEAAARSAEAQARVRELGTIHVRRAERSVAFGRGLASTARWSVPAGLVGGLVVALLNRRVRA